MKKQNTDETREIELWFNDFYGEMNVAEKELMKQSFNEGKSQQKKEELEWLKKNREIIDGIDVIEVDKRIKQLEETKCLQKRSPTKRWRW